MGGFLLVEEVDQREVDDGLILPQPALGPGSGSGTIGVGELLLFFPLPSC